MINKNPPTIVERLDNEQASITRKNGTGTAGVLGVYALRIPIPFLVAKPFSPLLQEGKCQSNHHPLTGCHRF